MSLIIPNENGVSNCVCDGGHFLLSYFPSDMSYHFHGRHEGEITGKSIQIEYFNTQEELDERIVELGIIIPEDEE